MEGWKESTEEAERALGRKRGETKTHPWSVGGALWGVKSVCVVGIRPTPMWFGTLETRSAWCCHRPRSGSWGENRALDRCRSFLGEILYGVGGGKSLVQNTPKTGHAKGAC